VIIFYLQREKEENQSLFSTEVDDDILEKARQRLLNSSAPASKILFQESWESSSKEKLGFEEKETEKIKTSILKQANDYYEKGVIHFNNCEFEEAVLSFNKALNLNAFNLQYHLLKCEAFIQLGDIKSAIMALNKLLSLVVTLSIETADNEYEVLKSNLSQKLSFCYYLEGQTFYDCKYYLEALDCFTKASELRPNHLPFRIRSVSCLVALNRTNEALAFVNKIIEESEETQQNVHLYVLRARLHLKYNNVCYLKNDICRLLNFYFVIFSANIVLL
jgi:tetratricopeptide (TPR) repeat protein